MLLQIARYRKQISALQLTLMVVGALLLATRWFLNDQLRRGIELSFVAMVIPVSLLSAIVGAHISRMAPYIEWSESASGIDSQHALVFAGLCFALSGAGFIGWIHAFGRGVVSPLSIALPLLSVTSYIWRFPGMSHERYRKYHGCSPEEFERRRPALIPLMELWGFRITADAPIVS